MYLFCIFAPPPHLLQPPRLWEMRVGMRICQLDFFISDPSAIEVSTLNGTRDYHGRGRGLRSFFRRRLYMWVVRKARDHDVPITRMKELNSFISWLSEIALGIYVMHSGYKSSKCRTQGQSVVIDENVLWPRGRSQITLTRFWVFLNTSHLHWHFLWYECWQKVYMFGPSKYLPRLLNVVCERPPTKYSFMTE